MQERDIVSQSKNAYNQWCVQWREQSKYHSKHEMKSLKDFENIGIGRAVLCIANGKTFEDEWELIKKYQDNVDIMCCDKTLGQLLKLGITPQYCMLCDANVSYETYMKPYEDKLKDTILFSNVCANPKWSDNGNWKDKYFFINKDVLGSEKEFIELSGCNNIIPAGTNVSNAMVIILTQCDEKGYMNFFTYDFILCIGYDYSWTDEGYYAFDKTGNGKMNYMKHIHTYNSKAESCYTSGNLDFSAKWFSKYVKTYKLPVKQCSKKSIVGFEFLGDLEHYIKYRYKPENAEVIKQLQDKRLLLKKEVKEIENKVHTITWDHYLNKVAY